MIYKEAKDSHVEELSAFDSKEDDPLDDWEPQLGGKQGCDWLPTSPRSQVQRMQGGHVWIPH